MADQTVKEVCLCFIQYFERHALRFLVRVVKHLVAESFCVTRPGILYGSYSRKIVVLSTKTIRH